MPSIIGVGWGAFPRLRLILAGRSGMGLQISGESMFAARMLAATVGAGVLLGAAMGTAGAWPIPVTPEVPPKAWRHRQ